MCYHTTVYIQHFFLCLSITSHISLPCLPFSRIKQSHQGACYYLVNALDIYFFGKVDALDIEVCYSYNSLYTTFFLFISLSCLSFSHCCKMCCTSNTSLRYFSYSTVFLLFMSFL